MGLLCISRNYFLNLAYFNFFQQVLQIDKYNNLKNNRFEDQLVLLLYLLFGSYRLFNKHG